MVGGRQGLVAYVHVCVMRLHTSIYFFEIRERVDLSLSCYQRRIVDYEMGFLMLIMLKLNVIFLWAGRRFCSGTF